MKVFSEATKALREVMLIAHEIDLLDEIYLVYSKQKKEYYVSTNVFDLEGQFYENWIRSNNRSEPELAQKEYKIFVYVPAENKKKWPTQFQSTKKSLLNGGNMLIRKEAEIEADVSVEFSIVQ